MTTTTINPMDKSHWLSLRAQDITSTEVSALFNMSPYQTLFEVWHRKKSGTYVSIDENERMKWGSRLESSIALGIAEDNTWGIIPKKHYIRDEDHKIGSSFDYEIIHPFKALLEIKNVDSINYSKSWDENEAPPHIELQVQHQMLVSGIDQAYIGALIGGNNLVLYKRTMNVEICKAILDKVGSFWKSIEMDIPPQPDFERDAKFIQSLNNYAEPGKILSSNDELDNLALDYKKISDEIKSLDVKKEEVKARMLSIIGDAEKIKGDSFTISAGIIGESVINYVRKPYRNFKITYKKGE